MESPSISPRSPLRFSMRTMLVLVTVACIFYRYITWAMNWKRQREAFIRSPGVYQDAKIFPRSAAAPIWIQIVGAQAYNGLILWTPTDQQLEEAKRLFPEAEVTTPAFP